MQHGLVVEHYLALGKCSMQSVGKVLSPTVQVYQILHIVGHKIACSPLGALLIAKFAAVAQHFTAKARKHKLGACIPQIAVIMRSGKPSLGFVGMA